MLGASDTQVPQHVAKGETSPSKAGCTQPSIPRGSRKHPPETSPKAKKHLPELQLPLPLLIGIFLPFPTGRWLGGEAGLWERQHGPSALSPCRGPGDPRAGSTQTLVLTLRFPTSAGAGAHWPLCCKKPHWLLSSRK